MKKVTAEISEARAMALLVRRGVFSLAEARFTIAVSADQEARLYKMLGPARTREIVASRHEILRLFDDLITPNQKAAAA
jgi:hypothetical protein